MAQQTPEGAVAKQDSTADDDETTVIPLLAEQMDVTRRKVMTGRFKSQR